MAPPAFMPLISALLDLRPDGMCVRHIASDLTHIKITVHLLVGSQLSRTYSCAMNPGTFEFECDHPCASECPPSASASNLALLIITDAIDHLISDDAVRRRAFLDQMLEKNSHMDHSLYVSAKDPFILNPFLGVQLNSLTPVSAAEVNSLGAAEASSLGDDASGSV